MHRARNIAAGVAAALLGSCVATGMPAGAQTATPTAAQVPQYDHIFVIVEENHGYSDVIGNPAAPNLNALANQFGLETNYFGISHPSEPNYVALLGGSTFGVSSDDPYYTNSVNAPSLITQLDNAGISWKAYLQDLPYAGYQGVCYPLKCNGAPDSDPLYVSKHNAIMNFVGSRTPADWNRQVPVNQMQGDLSSGNVPRFNYVIPTECGDQHGDPPYCIDSGNPDLGNLATADPQDQRLVAQGDQYLGQLVSNITNAPFWSQGNNAIAITYDEGDTNSGCCDAGNGITGNKSGKGLGGGQVATVMVTSHGPRALKDPLPANHYSLLQTIQDSFGLGCLQATCDTNHVTPLTRLLTVTGAPAVATTPITPPTYTTPTPTPTEPVSYTTSTVSSGGWTVSPSPLLGTGDNGYGAIAGDAPNDVWAVGDFAPDTATSNQDATLALSAHYDGTTWTAVPTPNGGPNFNVLYGVAANSGKAWAVGVDMSDGYQSRGLIESWNGSSWSIANNPQPGAERDLLFGAAATSPNDVWAVGDQQQVDQGPFTALAEHFDGTSWSVVPTPTPGAAGDHLYGVTAIAPNDVWAVGQQLSGSGGDQPLVEHWDGTAWSVVATPTLPAGTSSLYSVTAGPSGVYAAGETDDDVTGAAPLIEHYTNGAWVVDSIPQIGSTFPEGSRWDNLWSIAASGNTIWAVGAIESDPATRNSDVITLQGQGDTWTINNSPNPGAGSNILGGVATAGNTVWAAGLNDQGNSNLTFLESHPG